MKASAEQLALRRAGFRVAALTVVVGLLAWALPGLRDWLNSISFDTYFLLRSTQPVSGIVIVAMDEESYWRLEQKPDDLWDRALHAQLLDTLLAQGARGVVFDIVFADAWPDAAVDRKLTAALQRAKGKVVLAASAGFVEKRGQAGGVFNLVQPLAPFAAAAPWGVVEVPSDADGTIRRHANWPQHPHLSVRAAELAGAAVPDADGTRWINYYGPLAFQQVSYWQALQTNGLAPDLFSNQVVFVGRSFAITARGPDTGDEHPTPLTRWSGRKLSGVELQATAFANLLRNDWINALPVWAEILMLILTGCLFGFGLTQFRPPRALAGALAGMAVSLVLAAAAFQAARIWFPWLIIVGIQIPLATVGSALSFVLRAAKAKDIPDHELLCCVGRGGYGEVWLARNAINGFHAVKIIYRKNFPHAEPFEREFKGIQTFAPLSRSHPGLVHILHVGRNDLRGCFYYVMEAADDASMGAKLTPEHYTPRTLAGVIAQRGRLPVRECVQLGLQLSAALEHLHQQRLVHRDIKPANIIFVGGQPKLADVGLVTVARTSGGQATRVGTAGFLAPEGPGTPAADIFALGRTLYEAATGCECGRFPELPADLSTGPEADALLKLHEILLTACETDPADRYPTAAAMRQDLLELQRALVTMPPRPA